MWISRKNMHFRSTPGATHMKLSTLLLSLGNSSVVTEDQVRGFCTGASPAQAFRQRPHPHLKATLAIQSRGTEAAHVPAGLAGRVRAGCTSVPGDVLSHLGEHQIPHGQPGMRSPMCSVPAYYTRLAPAHR